MTSSKVTKEMAQARKRSFNFSVGGASSSKGRIDKIYFKQLNFPAPSNLKLVVNDFDDAPTAYLKRGSGSKEFVHLTKPEFYDFAAQVDKIKNLYDECESMLLAQNRTIRLVAPPMEPPGEDMAQSYESALHWAKVKENLEKQNLLETQRAAQLLERRGIQVGDKGKSSPSEKMRKPKRGKSTLPKHVPFLGEEQSESSGSDNNVGPTE